MEGREFESCNSRQKKPLLLNKGGGFVLSGGKAALEGETDGPMIVRKPFGLSVLLFVGALSALFVSGCRLNPRSEGGEARVRLINAVPDAGGLNVSVDGQRVWKRAEFRSNTGYQGIASGSYPIRMDSASFGATLLARSLSFEKGYDYTVLALGQMRGGRSADMEVWEDDPPGRGEPGKTTVRLVNAAPGLEPVDLVVNNIVGLKAVAYGKRSPGLTLDGGSYDLKIVPADTPDALIGPVTLRLQAGRTYTLVAMGRASDQTLTLESYPDVP